MDIKEKVTIDMLTSESVSILTQKFIELDGVETQVGQNHRIAYINSENGRLNLIKEQNETTVASIMAIWGDSPTVKEEDINYGETYIE